MDYWGQQILNWIVRYPQLKTQLFRFVEVLPALQDDRDIARHLQLYLRNGLPLPGPLAAALSYERTDSPLARLAAWSVRLNARRMAAKFVAGSNSAEALNQVRRLRRRRQAFTLDLLGEAITSEQQAEAVTATYIDLIRDLSTASRNWPRIHPIDFCRTGPYPIVNLSVKLTALYSQFDPVARERTMDVVGRRLGEILRAAQRHGAFINVDIEQYRYKEIALAIFRDVLGRGEFADFAHAGIVIQAYLRDAEEELSRLIAWNAGRQAPLAIRLVKGAYWDYEASLAGHRVPPVHLEKWQSDACFERCTAELFRHAEHIRPAFGTHNVRSIAHALACAEQHGFGVQDYEIQMLFGMGDPLKSAISGMGYFLRIYTPYGSLVPGMAYLIRRLLENTANESFLRQNFTEHQPPEVLLATPGPPPATDSPRGNADRGERASQRQEEKPMSAFRNEPFTDFASPENREKMQGALRDVRAAFGATYPLVIAGQRVTTGRWIESVNPAACTEVVGRVASASVAEADQAAAAARAALDSWRRTPHGERAAVLRRAADIMRRRRFELDALLVLEAGKPWTEADGDVAEAIDFCDYYAGEIHRLCDHPQTRQSGAEVDTYFYEPRGVVLVIAPWNFPLAILCGMTVAALVTGNTVIMKPASLTAVIGARLMDILEQAGLPPGALNFVPGPGAAVGEHLLRHPDVNMVVFTGSRSVGLHMIQTAAQAAPGQRFIKKVIAELGGKNAIIVDGDADLDAAVSGVVASAFGYAGQKCSACSRAIVVAPVYSKFVDKLAAAGRSIRAGAPEDPATFLGPVIDDGARQTILKYADTARREGRVVVDTDVRELARQGFFVGPMVVADVDRRAVIAQEEIFGPILAVIKARDFDDALDIANDTSYALTGGLFSRDPAHIRRISRELQAGNIYINRKITGALVDRQPFGGFKMSGIGSKAGGPDYLIQFLEPRSITENKLRTGLAGSET
jgi:RHH-type proline utilization regulon transcriptional repressor/proline dehydrogenase/delta 1-pyrroline-5-carboxylate dehydrogenase